MTPDRRGHGVNAGLKRQIIVLKGAVSTLGLGGGRSGGLEGCRGSGGCLCRLGCGRSRAYRHGTSRWCIPEATLLAITALLLVGRGLSRLLGIGLRCGRGLLVATLGVTTLRLGRSLLLGVGLGGRLLRVTLLLVGRSLRVASLRVALIGICGRFRSTVSGRLLREEVKLGNVNVRGKSFDPLLVFIRPGLDFSFHVYQTALSHEVAGDLRRATPEYQTMPLSLLLGIAILIPVSLISGQPYRGHGSVIAIGQNPELGLCGSVAEQEYFVNSAYHILVSLKNCGKYTPGVLGPRHLDRKKIRHYI